MLQAARKSDYRYFFQNRSADVAISIICDFDGTVTPFDVTDALLGNFAHPSWEEVEKDWLSGKISSRECMDRQVGLIEVSREKLDTFLDTIPLTPGFDDFITFCRSQRLDILILSDGLDYAIKHILSRHGLGFVPVIANRLRFQGISRYRLEFPYSTPGCSSGVCKCAVAGVNSSRTLLIGDGKSDCCLAGRTSLVLAREGKDLLAHCRSRQYPHVAWKDFFDVRAALGHMLTSAPQALSANG